MLLPLTVCYLIVAFGVFLAGVIDGHGILFPLVFGLSWPLTMLYLIVVANKE